MVVTKMRWADDGGEADDDDDLRLPGAGRRSPSLGILAFEAASTMTKLLSLHRSLSEKEVARLRSNTMRAAGVEYLSSTDQAFLLRLACAEAVAALDAAAAAVARLGARCGLDFAGPRDSLRATSLRKFSSSSTRRSAARVWLLSSLPSIVPSAGAQSRSSYSSATPPSTVNHNGDRRRTHETETTGSMVASGSGVWARSWGVAASAAAAEAEHQVKRRLLLDVVVGQRAAVFQLLPREDEPLLIRRDPCKNLSSRQWVEMMIN
uniref:DUF3475 domain-containing protein n=1 Tax=Oryza glumipatula TaxID=40148 RepID=A0A0E0A079_9ORYZ